jgi:hypothetical protein
MSVRRREGRGIVHRYRAMDWAESLALSPSQNHAIRSSVRLSSQPSLSDLFVEPAVPST